MKRLHQNFIQRRAPELYGDFWFNSEPIALQALTHQPVLLFFWDYTSPQSRRLIPFVNALYAIYAEFGVVVVGVHSPEFFFAKDIQKVEQAIKDQFIAFPVLTDNDRMVTNAYGVSSIPTFCFIDHRYTIYDIVTENFQPERIERSLQHLLRQSGYRGELPILLNPETEEDYQAFDTISKEIFTGYSHGALGNPEGYSPELPAEYADPHLHVNGKFYAQGVWIASRNAFEYNGEPDAGYFLCQGEGRSVDILIGSAEPARVDIQCDDHPIPSARCGNDVQVDANRSTYFDIFEPRLVSVLRNNSLDPHALKLTPSKSGVTVYMVAYSSSSPSSIPEDENEDHRTL